MLVEVLGLPGSGKSTLIRHLLPHLRKLGLRARRADKISGLPCIDPAAPRYLKRGADRTMLYRALEFRRRNPELLSHVETRLDLNSSEEFLFSLTTGLYQAYHEHADTLGMVFLDEGFAHRGVSAHLKVEEAVYHDYMNLIPIPDLIIHLSLLPHEAFHRAVKRRADKGFSQSKVSAKLGDLDVFRHRHRLLINGLSIMQKRGAQVVEVDTIHEIGACIDSLVPLVEEAFTQSTTDGTAALQAAE